MTRRHMSALARGCVATLGAVVAFASVAVAEPGGAGAGTTYGDHSTLFRSLEIVVGISLLASGAVLLRKRATGLVGALAVIAMTAWYAPVFAGWDGGPSPLRSIALAVAPVLAAAVFGLAALIPPASHGRLRSGTAGAVVLVLAASLAAGVALVLSRDPLRDLYCWSDCTVQPVGGGHDLERTRRLAQLVLGLTAAAGAATVLVGALRLVRSEAATRRSSRPALASAVLTGAALSAYAVALHLEPRELPGRHLYAWLFFARGVGLIGLAAGLGWLAFRPWLVRGRVRRLAVDLEHSSVSGGLGEMLGRALGDPGLTLVFPLRDDDRVVDATGQPVDITAMANPTPIVGAEGVVAYVLSARSNVSELESELGPAGHLALGNERLRAEALARLGDVTRSRARIVEAADEARRRMERDLHDGAQQRMLALTYDLRVALTLAESRRDEPATASLRAALDRAVDAAAELRDLAHGIFPAELEASGLEAALESLADVRPIRLAIELAHGRRFPDEIETAAYAVVAEAAEDDLPLEVAAVERDGSLVITVEGDTEWSARALALDDRIGAAGGTVRVAGARLEATLPVPSGS